MSESFLILARGIFDQKFGELEKIRDALLRREPGDPMPISDQKLKEYEKLLSELGKKHRQAEKILAEVRKLFSKAKKK